MSLMDLAERESLRVPAKHAQRDSDGDRTRAPTLARPDIMRALLNATDAEWGEAMLQRRERKDSRILAELQRTYR